MPLRIKLVQQAVHFSIISLSCAEVIHICAMFLSTIFFIMRLFKTEHWKENGCWYSKCYDIKLGLCAKHTPEMEIIAQSASNCLICPRPTSLDVKTHSYSSTPLLPKLNFFVKVLRLTYTKMLSNMPSSLNIFRISNKGNRFHTLKNIECRLCSRHCAQSFYVCQS